MKLKELLKDVPVRATHGDLDVEISVVTSDSRLAVRGSLFVAIPGTKDDGTKYISSAKQKGAVAIVAERGQATVEVDDARASLALIAANFYGRPANKLSLIGVTGTSGKTTTTKMIESILAVLKAGAAYVVIEPIYVRSGWPVELVPVAREARRRYDAKLLGEDEYYCSAAVIAGAATHRIAG